MGILAFLMLFYVASVTSNLFAFVIFITRRPDDPGAVQPSVAADRPAPVSSSPGAALGRPLNAGSLVCVRHELA